MQALFGENFRQARTKAGLTQRDIEAQTGIKQAYISQIEGGKQNPTLGTMMILAHAIGKDVRVLLREPTASTRSK
jgi:transcriptional regulator with XRE-family HTH domain